MPNDNQALWTTLAPLAGECDAHRIQILALRELNRLSLRWLKAAQDAHVTNEMRWQVHKLDAARRAVIKQAAFGIAGLGIGFGIQAVALAGKAGSAAPMLTGGARFWTVAGRMPAWVPLAGGRALAAPIPAFGGRVISYSLVGPNPLLAAGFTIEQIIAQAIPGAVILTMAKVGRVEIPFERDEAYRAYLKTRGDYERSLERALEMGFSSGFSADRRHFGVLLSAAANGRLNDVRNRLSEDLAKIVAVRPESARERALLLGGASVDLWYDVYQWSEARLNVVTPEWRQRLDRFAEAARGGQVDVSVLAKLEADFQQCTGPGSRR